jgi:putative MATE family efflux protein
MDDQRIKLLRDEKISKAVTKSAIPAIIGLMVLAIYNVVDTMFVAWLGTSATGATQVVLPMAMLFSAIGLGFGMGGGSYVSRLLGMNKQRESNQVATVSLMTSMSIGIVGSLTCIVMIEPILGFFGADAEVMNMSKEYGQFILIGSIFSVGNMTLNNLLRSEGSGKLSMMGQLTGALLNIALDPIFIFTFGLGIRGAAMATALSQMVAFSILMSKYIKKQSVVRINPKYFRPTKAMYGEIFKVGIPTFFRQILFSISLGLLNQGAIKQGGPDLLAGIGILFKVTMIPSYIIFGLGQGFQPVAGYNYGAKNKKRVIDALKFSFVAATIISVLSAGLMLLFDVQIFSVFRPEVSVMAYCIDGLVYYAVAIVLMAMTNTVGVFYQALGKGRESLILSIARQGLFFIPAVFILPSFLGITGVLSVQLVADALTVILTGYMFVTWISSDALNEEMKSHV